MFRAQSTTTDYIRSDTQVETVPDFQNTAKTDCWCTAIAPNKWVKLSFSKRNLKKKKKGGWDWPWTCLGWSITTPGKVSNHYIRASIFSLQNSYVGKWRQRHKPTELAHTFLFSSCVYFRLYGDVAVYVFVINQPSLPTPFYSVPVPISVFMGMLRLMFLS